MHINDPNNLLTDDVIQDYDLGADEHITDHDAMCISQAGKLLQIGYLEYEIAAYATTYQMADQRYYYIADGEKTMSKFLQNCQENNIWPTPVKYYFKRYDLIDDTEETIKRKFRIEVAQKLKAAYPPLYFEAMDALTATFEDNQAFPLLHDLSRALNSCFDINHLKLFGSLLGMMRQGRLLDATGHLLLTQWLQNEYEKLAIEPIASGSYKRTYAGFAYLKPTGGIGYFCDAFPYMATEKQTTFISRGYTVTPILTTTYYADSFQNLQSAREKFKADLTYYLGEMYLPLMALLNQLHPCVDAILYQNYHQQLQTLGSQSALEAFCYYGNLWNIDLANLTSC